MPRIILDGRGYELTPGESVLEGMARHGVRLPSACRSGVCQACLLRAASGDPGPGAQSGLKDTWRSAGYFLACQARPGTDVTITPCAGDLVTGAVLVSTTPLGAGVLRVRIRPDQPLDFRPGQHVTLHHGDVVRAYSIANLPDGAARAGLEFHVRLRPGGAMSEWLGRARPGARAGVRGPAGECFYVRGNPRCGLLLAGSGTGIAPLTAIARDALELGHTGPMVILHGAADDAGLYLERELRELSRAHPALRYVPCVRSHGEYLATAAARELAGLGGAGRPRAYLCGSTRAVLGARRALFLAGMSLRDIHADEFLPARP